jgi:serralysin
MHTRHVWIVAALAVGLVAGCSKDRATDDNSPIEVQLHECPDNPLVECQIVGAIAVETSMNEMGTPVSRVTYTYRDLPDGNRSVLEEFDNSAAGTVDARLTTSYDADDNLIEALWEPNPDTGRGERHHLFPPPGTPCMANALCEEGYDLCVCNEHDDLIARQHGEWAPPDRTTTRTDLMGYTYDAHGNMLTREVDRDGDGTVDARLTTSYDDDGTAIEALWEPNLDTGRGERHHLFLPPGTPCMANALCGRYGVCVCNEHDDLIARQHGEWAPPDRTNTRTDLMGYTYDADGNMLTREIDRDGDGTVDVRTTYDADGNLLTYGTVYGGCTYDPPCPAEVHRDDPTQCPDPTCVEF